MKNSSLFLFFGLLTFIQLTACSQEKELDCQALLREQPYMFRQRQQAGMNMDSVNHDYTILQECGNLDSIDGVIFQGPLIGQLLIAKLNKGGDSQEITYQSLIDLISEFKTEHTSDYQQLRTGTIARLEIENMPVKLTEFENIRPKLIATGMKEKDVEEFKVFLEKNQRNWTYKEAVKAFFYTQNPKPSTGKSLEFPIIETLEKALQEAGTAKKNCLIYFSGWTTVNARKFESQVLTDPKIQNTIKQNFIYKVAYVDDRNKLPDGSDIGKTNTKLQIEKFKSNTQPELYILSPDGKIIADWNYFDGTSSFISFLEKGIKN
ncbi:hypothetical protein [Fluviicola sp.]|uniref:hypothetical protein n=1 Tax=Fluviicola sp. TaxID=1917219 RepID=UPI003D296C48